MAENTENQEKVMASKDPFEFLIDSMLSIEKQRVATQIRQTHLFLNGLKVLIEEKEIITEEESKKLEKLSLKQRKGHPVLKEYYSLLSDKETDGLLEKLVDLEKFVDGRIASLITKHPTYPWFSKIKGIGKENIGKVVGFIDIRKAETISALWHYAGYHVIDGKAPKRTKGEKLTYNSTLRSMCYRLATSLMKGKGSFYELYIAEKTRLAKKYDTLGIKIVPAAKIKNQKENIPIESKLISEGQVHNQALRKMIKIFLGCLWIYWRKAENLPVRDPYAIEKLGHTTLIQPEEMIDK